ncbi:MAG: hypothetical protein QXN55_03855 [Candidatus Nitrosotenuis sp.]
MARNLIVCSVLLSFFVIVGTMIPSFADEIKASDEIRKNPAMMKMLEKIELSKKILAQMQEKKTADNSKSQQLQDVRNKVKSSLDEQLSRMSKDYEEYTPQNSFARFVSKKPADIQPIYQSMFVYHQDKVSAAKAEKDRILSSGGKMQDALDAYRKLSATNKVKLVQLNKELSIKYSNADITIQNTFDEKGKLPRTR